jgi:hypothetical protein
MSFRQGSGWKSISMHEAKARAGVQKRGMTAEEERASRPVLKRVPVKVTFKTGRMLKNQQERFARTIKLEDWAKELKRPFTVGEASAMLGINESSIRDTLAAARVRKESKLPSTSPSGRGSGQWTYVFDDTLDMDSPLHILQKYGDKT